MILVLLTNKYLKKISSYILWHLAKIVLLPNLHCLVTLYWRISDMKPSINHTATRTNPHLTKTNALLINVIAFVR